MKKEKLKMKNWRRRESRYADLHFAFCLFNF